MKGDCFFTVFSGGEGEGGELYDRGIANAKGYSPVDNIVT
jgi:hypothetical protein